MISCKAGEAWSDTSACVQISMTARQVRTAIASGRSGMYSASTSGRRRHAAGFHLVYPHFNYRKRPLWRFF
jgi:hypothetical protein